MKANRAFRSQDEAVSPVIAVILMVAITVVLAATVYVWVSGFGANSSQPAKSISLTKSNSGPYTIYTISSATSGLRWSDMKFTVSGATLAYQIGTSLGDVSGAPSTSATLTPASTTPVTAGQQVYILNNGASAQNGLTLNALDLNANSVMSTIGGANTAAPTAGSLSISSVQRTAGTAGTYTSGVLKLTMSAPFQLNTITLSANGGTGIYCSNGHRFGTDSTVTVTSPTTININLGPTANTCVGADAITFGAGMLDATGAAGGSPVGSTLTAYGV